MDINRMCRSQEVAQHQPPDILSQSPSHSPGVVDTPRVLQTTSLATLDNSLVQVLCLDHSLVQALCLDNSLDPMELLQQAASVLTHTAECSQVRVRPTLAPLSEEKDMRMELVKHF